jgi:hypothetical protein
MTRSTAHIACDIAAFQPTDGNWLALDRLLNELWTQGDPAAAIPAMLSVFERFPDEDGAGVLWSIVHGLESLAGYEPLLLSSVLRAPSDLGVTMLGRLLNASVQDIGGTPIMEVLRSIAQSDDASANARETAAGFLLR